LEVEDDLIQVDVSSIRHQSISAHHYR